MLDRAVQNVSGRTGVQTALSGIEVYKNITDAVNAAEEAVKKAKEAADKALNVGDITERALISKSGCIQRPCKISGRLNMSECHCI